MADLPQGVTERSADATALPHDVTEPSPDVARVPYGVIWNRLKNGMVVPFLGAGASFVGRPRGAQWEEGVPFLPSGSELSRVLAIETSFPQPDQHLRDNPATAESYYLADADRGNLAKVSSYYADINGRPILRDRLREILSKDYHYGAIHEFLASVPAHLLIITTNYDTLIEQAFIAAEKPYDLVVYPADDVQHANAVLWWKHNAPTPEFPLANNFDIDPTKTTVIFKMHGTIKHESDKYDNFVITEEDYVEFLSRMTTNAAIPSVFFSYARTRSFLFLGYSLGDWNLRVVLRNLDERLSQKRTAANDQDPRAMTAWAIEKSPSELERWLWQKRRVNIFDLTVDEFVSEMQKRRA